jgi:hypothetical protein
VTSDHLLVLFLVLPVPLVMQNTPNEHYSDVNQIVTNTSYALKEAPNEQL